MTDADLPPIGDYTVINYPTTTGTGGDQHKVAVLMIGDVVVATLHQSLSGGHRQHVVGGIAIAPRGKYGLRDYQRTENAPASGANLWEHEPTPDEVAADYQELIDREDAAGFVRWAEKGTPVPDGKSDAWHVGRVEASKRYRRHVRQGRIVGERKTW